jgi:hypothetical protein
MKRTTRIAEQEERREWGGVLLALYGMAWNRMGCGVTSWVVWCLVW